MVEGVVAAAPVAVVAVEAVAVAVAVQGTVAAVDSMRRWHSIGHSEIDSKHHSDPTDSLLYLNPNCCNCLSNSLLIKIYILKCVFELND